MTDSPEFERTYALAQWLMDRLHNDADLLRAMMGGSPHVRQHDAMSVLEREAAEQGWTRGDIDRALSAIAVN